MSVKLVLRLLAFGCCVNFIKVDGERNITVNLGNYARTDLKSYLADMKVAAASIQYTADLNNRLISELQKALDNDMVSCQAKGGNVRSDYEKGGPNVYYKYHSDRLTWNEARKSCGREGARLAYYSTSTEQVNLITLRLENEGETKEMPFLGVHRFFEKDDWVTNSGLSLSNMGHTKLLDFVSGKESEKCGCLDRSGYIQSSDCEVERSYFCEIRLN